MSSVQDLITSFESLNNEGIIQLLNVISSNYITNAEVRFYLFKRYIETKDQKFGVIVMNLIGISPENINRIWS